MPMVAQGISGDGPDIDTPTAPAEPLPPEDPTPRDHANVPGQWTSP